MTTEAQAIAELQKKADQQPHTVLVGDEDHTVQVLMVPNGAGGWAPNHVKQFTEPYRKAPERRRGTAVLTDLVSFISHVKRFADTDSVVFADKSPASPKLTAVLDYHKTGAAGDPRFGTHRSVYTFPLSDEWKAWAAQDGVVMSQVDFAAFIEENLADVADPSSALDGAKKFSALMSCAYASASALLELSRGLTVHVGAKVAQHVNLQTGVGKVTFETKHADESGAPVSVPGAFLIQIPAFKEGPLYQIPARLRYRVNSGNITWSYDLYRASAVLDHAIQEGCDTVAEGTSLPVLSGSPES
jgi:uncharacterized protein YfdQ (DUF2303 family)